jgi:predicted transcriptional regulator
MKRRIAAKSGRTKIDIVGAENPAMAPMSWTRSKGAHLSHPVRAIAGVDCEPRRINSRKMLIGSMSNFFHALTLPHGCGSPPCLTFSANGNILPCVNRLPDSISVAAIRNTINSFASKNSMPKQHLRGRLGARERQIMDAIYQLGEASVAQVLEKLSDPPSYSAIRTMIRLLEKKELLVHRQVGNKYVYRPAHSRATAMRSALKHLMQTFFAGSTTEAVAAILHSSAAKLTDDDVLRLEQVIEAARQKGK